MSFFMPIFKKGGVTVANRIKGITVEIGGDTTGLDKALKGVNSTIKSTQSQLQDVNRLLKLDPSNAKLLAQKQQLLQKEISETSEKLNALKEADKQAKVQLENGELGQDKYDALQREIIETENNLKSLQEEAKKVPSALSVSMKEAGDKIKEVGDKTTEVGKGLSTHVTAPIVAMGAASLKAFNDVDAGMDIIVQKTGASGKALEEMQTSMKNLATSIPTDFETAGAAIGEVNTRFGLTGQKLEDLSGKFIKFAQLNNTDVSTAIDNTQKVISAFGLKAEDAGALLDTMNAVGQRTGISMDILAKSMVTNSAALQQLGFSASDAANFLGNVEMSGADTSQVMTGLTKALATATANGKPMKEALKEIQDSMINAKSDTEGLEAAYELFGKRAGGAIYQACKNGSLSFEELGTSLKDNIGNVDSTFNETLDPIDKFQTSLNSLKIVGADVGNSLMSVLAPMLTKFSEMMKFLNEKWNSLSPGMQDAIVKIALIVAAIGPFLVVLGTCISKVGIAIKGLSKLALVFGKLKPSLKGMGVLRKLGTLLGGLSAQIITVVGIIGTLVVAFMHLWNSNEEFRNKILETWENIKATISSFVEGIKERLSSIGINFSSLVEGIKVLWEGLCQILAPLFEGAFKLIATTLEMLLGIITGILDVFIGLFTGNWSQLWTGIKEIFEGIWTGIKETFMTILQTLKGLADTFLSFFGTNWNETWTSTKDFFITAWNDISSFFTGILNGIKNIAESVWNGIKNSITSVIDGIKNSVTSIFTEVSSTVSSVFSGIKDTAVSIWNGIKNAIVTPIEEAKNAVKSVVDAITGFFAGIRLELPHIKLPHFSIKGEFSLTPPSTPYIAVDWYKQGGIMTKPTLFGMNGASLMAGGEAGAEAILPLDAFYTKLENILASKLNSNSSIEKYLSVIAQNSQKGIYLDNGALVGYLLPSIDDGLGKIANRKERGI